MDSDRYCNGCSRMRDAEQRVQCRREICIGRREAEKEADFKQRELWRAEREERARQANQQADAWDDHCL